MQDLFEKFDYNKILFIFFLIIFVCASNPVNAQVELLEKELLNDSTKNIFGPNEKHFINFLLGFGFIGGASFSALPINYPRCGYYNLGLMYRYKWKKNIFWGGDFGYRRFWYLLSQNGHKSFPTLQSYEDERFVFQNLSLNLFGRYKFKTKKVRSERLGLFADVGAGLELPLSVSYRTAYQENGENVEVNRTGLGYKRPIYFHTFVRVGYNRVFGRFAVRLGEIFKNAPQLPILHFGIEVGLY